MPEIQICMHNGAWTRENIDSLAKGLDTALGNQQDVCYSVREWGFVSKRSPAINDNKIHTIVTK